MSHRNQHTGDRQPNLEIQIHPSDIQKGVKYFFLSRRQIWLWCLAGVTYLAFMGLSAAVAPNVIATLLSRREYDNALITRDKLGARLDALGERLSELNDVSDALNLRMGQIYLAYGLPNDSIGQGGYPTEPRPVPESAFADQIREAGAIEAELQQEVQVLDAFLTEIQSFEDAHRDQVLGTPSISPLRGDHFVLTSPFGNRVSPFTKESDFHAGIDLAAPTGSPIYAPADGVVAYAGRYPLRRSVAWWRYGNLVSLKHEDRFITIYGHLHEIKVRARQRVKQGDVIGTVGNTGWSTNPHLHYEIRRLEDEDKFRPVDPRIYILDHRWRDEERLLVRARTAPEAQDFEPLPSLITR